MRKYFRKITRRIVAIYANRIYRQAVELAERRHRNDSKTRYFVISDPRNQRKLMVLSTEEFIAIRKRMGLSSAQCPVSMLTAGCWYMTANANSKGRMDAGEVMKRKYAFVLDLQRLAGLASR